MIIGHEKIISKLNKLIDNNEVAHSYIFNGPEGIGKMLVAMEFAKSILCSNDVNHKNTFDNGNHPDFKLIKPDEKGTIKVEIIREMIKDISIKPIMSANKVYIIDAADCITAQAQNALLKTLEEPPYYAIIILITSRYNSLLTTIRSRSQKLDFQKIEKNDIIKYIEDNNFEIDIEHELLMNLINGSIGNISKVSNNIEAIKVLIDFVDRISELNVIELNKFSQEIMKYKENILTILDYLEIIIFEKIKNNTGAEFIKSIESTKKNIQGNINFEICIDKMLLDFWEVNNV